MDVFQRLHRLKKVHPQKIKKTASYGYEKKKNGVYTSFILMMDIRVLIWRIGQGFKILLQMPKLESLILCVSPG